MAPWPLLIILLCWASFSWAQDKEDTAPIITEESASMLDTVPSLESPDSSPKELPVLKPKGAPVKLNKDDDVLTDISSIEKATPSKTTLSAGGYVQKEDLPHLNPSMKIIKLNEVLEQGLRESHDEHLREWQSSLYDSQWQGIYAAFWFPHVQLSLTTEEQRISRLYRGGKKNHSYADPASGSAGLSFGEYTVFNWGKDYLKYLNNKTSYLRNKEVLGERRRELKHNLIMKFFELYYLKNAEETTKLQLRHASFLYRINREKLSVGKVSKQEYLQARAEYLRAQQEFYDAKLNSQLADEQMSYLLADPVGTRYSVRQQLRYQELNADLNDLVRIALQDSDSIQSAMAQVETTDRDYQIMQKENLPLPKFSVNLGAYTNSFSRHANRTIYETHPNDSNLDLVASINATWDIVGERGLLNSHQRQTAVINRGMALETLGKNRDLATSNVRELFKQIKNLQNQVTILEAELDVTKRSFDVVMDNYLNRKTSFLNFKDALMDRTHTDIDLQKTRYEHLRAKVLLAGTMGVENPPGEILEKLVLEEKLK